MFPTALGQTGQAHRASDRAQGVTIRYRVSLSRMPFSDTGLMSGSNYILLRHQAEHTVVIPFRGDYL